MTTRAERDAARTAPERTARTRELAELMREQRHGAEEGLSLAAAQAAGFSLAEIEVYADEAMALARTGTPVVLAPPCKRAPGSELVRQARAIRTRRSEQP